MKKYIQSVFYIAFLIVTFIGLTTAFVAYENPFDIYENPLVWIALISFALVVILKEVLNVVALKRAEDLELEKQGINPASIDKYAWFKKIIKQWTKSKAIDEEEEIILDHNYDGIKELDNSLPPWWIYMFYATILFGVIYLVKYHVLDGDDQATEYQKELAEAKQLIDKFKSNPNTKIIDATTAQILTDESSLKRGKAIFNLNCVSCHAVDGGGGIGPNLTDENWILGGGISNVFTTISEGGRSGKGMIAWKATLKSADIEKVASYILSLQGTTPAKPKKPEGEIWKE
ncbi:cbb3-type cytochrome c oxidase N-terminal domain-containing protein [Pseudotenacibaculum sp. MALMAid0570]|uniref:cbb3-type cytochrome c oxidase N-terminal domain-containing protein n=1 Tax=Pseudotenacibaculum sp. MALMAid0570 TaxID=3143938 RepID=UPI0032DEF371